MEAVVTFNSIALGGRGVTAPGTLKLHDGGIAWKKNQGSTTVSINKTNVQELRWCVAPGGAQLRVRQKAGPTVLFNGFPKAGADELESFAKEHFGFGLIKESYALSGHNWGKLSVHGSSVAFQVGGKHSFELPLPEVGEVQGQKDEAIMEFHVDDTAISDREDALCAVTFVIPDGNEDFPSAEGDDAEGKSSAQVFKDLILDKTDVLAASQEEAIASISQVAALVPRGRYNVEFHPGFMDMDGQNHQYKIRYTSMHRLYVLPRPMPAGNLVVIALDPPIRRGQTFYPQIVCFFDASTNLEVDLNISEEFMQRKNVENRANLELHMNGRADNVMTRILRGLSGAKVTKHGSFLAADRESPWLSCSYKNESGTLYPLERAFFYVLKPTLLIPFEDIESVEFERQQSGMHAASVRTFDLMINMRADARGKDTQHLFRNIERSEWTNILNFLEEKKIKVENLDTAKQGPSAVPTFGLTEAGDVDPGLAALDDEEEDDDFVGGGDGDGDDEDFGSGAGSSGEDSDGDSGSDAELIAEEGISVDKISGSRKRSRADDDEEEGAEAEAPKPKKEKKEKPEKKEKKAAAPKEPKEAGDGKKEKKPRKKKDKNAPKRGLSAYMFFTTAKREQIKEENPGITFTEIPKKVSVLWAALSPEDKAPYEEMARKDKERYEQQNAEYKAKLAAAGDAGDEGDGQDAASGED